MGLISRREGREDKNKRTWRGRAIVVAAAPWGTEPHSVDLTV